MFNTEQSSPHARRTGITYSIYLSCTVYILIAHIYDRKIFNFVMELRKNWILQEKKQTLSCCVENVCCFTHYATQLKE